MKDINMAICQVSKPALKLHSHLPAIISSQHPYFLHKLCSQSFSWTHAQCLRESNLASSSLESATATAPLVTLPSYYLYLAFRSGSHSMPTWFNLPGKTLLSAKLCAQLYYQIWLYLSKREICRITCQESRIR